MYVKSVRQAYSLAFNEILIIAYFSLLTLTSYMPKPQNSLMFYAYNEYLQVERFLWSKSKFFFGESAFLQKCCLGSQSKIPCLLKTPPSCISVYTNSTSYRSHAWLYILQTFYSGDSCTEILYLNSSPFPWVFNRAHCHKSLGSRYYNIFDQILFDFNA